MIFAPDLERECPAQFPDDLRRWTGESALARLAVDIARTTCTDVALGDQVVAADDRLLAVLTGSYAAGIFSSEDIEWAAAANPMVRTLCRGGELSRTALVQFRRANRELVEVCLGRLFFAAWQTRRMVVGGGRNEVVEGEAEPLAEAMTEARNRVQLAILFDLAMSE